MKTIEAEDPVVVAAVRAGDTAMFERLVRDHGAMLLAVARRILRSDDEAREALQDAFVSAFRSCNRFEGGSRVSTWLHRIVVNACLMRLRNRRRQHEVSIDPWLPTFLPDGHHDATFVDWSNEAYSRLEQEEVRAAVRSCIDQLPETYRAVLMMRDIEGVAVAEIAAALEISDQAVHMRLHRARQALRRLLDPIFRQEQS